MSVENYDMRLQFLKDFGITDYAFTDTSGGTTATITALLRKQYVEVVVEGEVGVESNASFAFFGLQMCRVFSRETRLVQLEILLSFGHDARWRGDN